MSDQREAVAAALHRRGEGGKETWGRAVEDQAPGTWGLVDYYREWADEIMEALTPDCGLETPEAAVEERAADVASPTLLWLLRRAGDEWGPAGVALVAADLAQGWTPPGTEER